MPSDITSPITSPANLANSAVVGVRILFITMGHPNFFYSQAKTTVAFDPRTADFEKDSLVHFFLNSGASH